MWFRVMILSLCGAWASAQPLVDLVIFDENDAVGADYYDASFGFAVAPSVITGAGPGSEKIPVLTMLAKTGENAGLLEWQSSEGGDWKFFVASPGWQTRNAGSYSNLVLYLNGPAAIPAARLPRVSLESSINLSTASVRLGDYYAAGLDADPESWERVVIPLDTFHPYGGFQLSQFKAVVFGRNGADTSLRELWFDNVRIVAQDSTEPGPPPGPPQEIVTRSGDRSVVLHWTANPESDVAYHVYRSISPEDGFERRTESPARKSNFADVEVENDQAYWYQVIAVDAGGQESEASAVVNATPRAFQSDAEFLDYVQRTAFDYFWYEANPTNGLVRDRSQPYAPASIAATGFGLTALVIGIDHGWITREAGRERVLRTMRTFWETPQGDEPTGRIGYKGWFYHFLEMETATRAGSSELSSIDTALLLAGMLDAGQYFDREDAEETEIRALAESIYQRVDWLWMTAEGDSLSMGWMPGGGFLSARWIGYNEAMILYLLGMGAPENPLPAAQWESWTSGYRWSTHYGISFVQFPPLFGHQYSHAWIDFRHIADPYMREKGITYFENSRRATLAQRAYAIENPGGFPGYSDLVWGFTASDGPGTTGYFPYIARGAPPPEFDDGTIAPTAVGGSLPFVPEHGVRVLRHWYDEYRVQLWSSYGFRDAFNLKADWWAPDVLGIDQGPILIMTENYRFQSVWRRFMRNPSVLRGLEAAGFIALPSVPVTLEVSPDAEVTLHWIGESDRHYQVEYSPDLDRWFIATDGLVFSDVEGVSWRDIGPPATDQEPGEVPQRYYRVTRLGEDAAN